MLASLRPALLARLGVRAATPTASSRAAAIGGRAARRGWTTTTTTTTTTRGRASHRRGGRRLTTTVAAKGGKGKDKDPPRASGLLSGVHPDSLVACASIAERAEAASDAWSVHVTPFLDPALAADALAVVGRMADVDARPWGGYDRAERVRLVIGRAEVLDAPPASEGDERRGVGSSFAELSGDDTASGAFQHTNVFHPSPGFNT